ncbi:hypothetical protein [Synechococcus phage Ssp-JY42]|nr:hypothetical protein [Synechococcus phage Yong-M4-211]
MQFAWDAAAFLSSLIACVFILARRRMLSGEHGTWHTAPPAIQAVLALQAIYMGTVCLSILFGDHVNQRETLAYVISAVVSVVFTVNLEREGRIRPPQRPQGREARR